MGLENTAYCVNCDSHTRYQVKSQEIDITVRGTKFGYIEQLAYCCECGEEVYVPEINDRNATSRENAFRASRG